MSRETLNARWSDMHGCWVVVVPYFGKQVVMLPRSASDSELVGALKRDPATDHLNDVDWALKVEREVDS